MQHVRFYGVRWEAAVDLEQRGGKLDMDSRRQAQPSPMT